jgi:hypothetical protein
MMSQTEEKPLTPDGRIRMPRLLSKEQSKAIRKVQLNGLNMLNIHVEDSFAQPETWIEYWFDSESVSEDEIRLQIQNALSNAQ